jgi:hypothetical protein
MYCRVESTSNIPGEALPQTHYIWQDQEEKELHQSKEFAKSRIKAYVTAGIMLTGLVVFEDFEDSQRATIDEQNAFTMEIEGSDFVGVSCPKTIPAEDVSLFEEEILVETTKSVEMLSGYLEYFSILDSIENAIDDNAAFNLATEYFESKKIGLATETDTDGIGLDRVTYEIPTKSQLQNLIMAVNTVPVSLIYQSGLQDISLSNRIFSAKSSTQKETETEMQLTDVEHNNWGGYYSSEEGKMGISTGSLDNPQFSIIAVWHELVGHGAVSKLCRPETDAEFYKLSYDFLDDEINYAPNWQQGNIQKILFESGKITENAYGGTNIHEDVATVAEALLFDNPFDQIEDSVVDEKKRLLIYRLALHEPNIAEYIYTIQNGLRYLSIIGEYIPKFIHPDILANLARPFR